MIDKIIYHISHNDLDGYGSSWIVANNLDVTYSVNVDYPDFKNELEKAITILNFYSTLESSKLVKLIITDIGLNQEILDILKNKLLNGVELLYIDHHRVDNSVLEDALRFTSESVLTRTIMIDVAFCATMLTYQHFHLTNKNKKLFHFSWCVDQYDRWIRENQAAINAMTFLSDRVYLCPLYSQEQKRKFIYNMFDFYSSGEVSAMQTIYNDSQMVSNAKVSSKAFQDHITKMEHDYIELVKGFVKNTRLPMTTEQSLILTELKEFELDLGVNSVKTDCGKKVAVVSIPSNNFQYLSAQFLADYPNDYDVIVRVNNKSGSMSFRSAKGYARKLASYFGGGGHDNAGGASAQTFLENNQPLLYDVESYQDAIKSIIPTVNLD